MTTKAQRAAAEADAELARNILRPLLPPGARLHVVCRGGVVTVLLPEPGDAFSRGRPTIRDITHLVIRAVPGWRWDKHQTGIAVGRAPTALHFHVAYTLGHALYPEGFTVDRASGCYGRNGAADGTHDRDGGYALKAVSL